MDESLLRAGIVFLCFSSPIEQLRERSTKWAKMQTEKKQVTISNYI